MQPCNKRNTSNFPASVEPASALSDVIAATNTLETALPPSAPAFNFGFLRNVTLEGIEPYLRYRMLTDGVRPKIVYGGYGSLRQDLLLPDSPLTGGHTDLMVTAIMLEELVPHYGLPGWTSSQARDELESIFEALLTNGAGTIALNTFIVPFRSEIGIMTSSDATDTAAEVTRLNEFVRDFVRRHSPRFCLMDWNRLAQCIGEAAAMDYRYWYLSKAPFKRAFLDALAQELVKVVHALLGRTKKCLVLDCDNTLWGGIIGEDGLEGIKLDGHEYPGRAFYDFQKTILQLAKRGVLVTLCSKNNERDVFEVLDRHPWSLLKRDHLTGFRINWKDKTANLADLAEELNLGLDSFVFVDDNPRELEMVRQMLPQVTILQVPERLYDYPALLLRDGLFDTLVTSQEDRHRTRLYQHEAQRKAERSQHQDLEDYLKSLELVATIHPASSGEITRIAQLTQKTNQFNLTTRRYTEHEIQGFLASPDYSVYTMVAGDRFGSLGLVGVFIAMRRGNTAMIDTLLMSCRALGRHLEHAFVLECMHCVATTWETREWEAEYLPSAKNSQVADFWETYDFTPGEQMKRGCSYYLGAPAPVMDPPVFIHIKRE